MKLLALSLVAAVFAAQSDEEKVAAMFKSYVDALRGGDYEKAADAIHPKSAAKIRDRILESMDKAIAGTRDRFVKTLEYKDYEELKAATPRDLFVRYLKHLKDLGEGAKQMMGAVEGAEFTLIGTLKKDDKIYVIVESVITLGTEKHAMPALYVAYKDGEAWKLAYRGETNIGK